MREQLTRLIDWVRRDRLERELAEELRFHRQQLERDALHGGMPADEVPHAARRRLGSLTRVTEEARERWSLPRLEDLLHDVRYAMRGLRRAPGFTATAVLTLALGIGANALMVDVVDRLMFRPYPYLAHPGSVHRIYLRTPAWSGRPERVRSGGLPYARFVDLKRWTTSFSQYAAFAHPTLAIGTGAAARERRVAAVSGTFWDFFDAAPALGRFFTAAEDSTPRGAEVAVLEYGFWQSELGGRDVIGQRIQIGHISATIIGVAPEGFTGVFDYEMPVVYIPITLFAGSNPAREDRSTYYTRYDWGWTSMMVRRKPGITLEQASADATQAYRRSWDAEGGLEPGAPPARSVNPTAMVSAMKTAGGPDPGLEARTALWVAGVAAIVLVIACINVTNLFLARALRRQREIAVRLALGVSRSRLARQSVLESLLLFGLGGIVGVVVAQWGGTAVRATFLTAYRVSLQGFTDWRTIGIVGAIVVVAGVVTGVVAGLFPARQGLVGPLKAGAREGTYQRSRIRIVLLVAQGALSVLLLVGAALFVRSLRNVNDLRMGYDAERVLVVRSNWRGQPRLAESGPPRALPASDSAERVTIRRRLLAAAQALPGVEHAAWVSSVPFWSTSSTDLYVAGIDDVSSLGRFRYQMATSDFFRAMGTRVLRGRGFVDSDREGSPRVTVVSASMARVLWPGKEAIGQCIRIRDARAPCTTVVGIAEDIVQEPDQLGDGRRFMYYLPLEQVSPGGGHSLVLRMRGSVAGQAEGARKALQAVMPGESYLTVRPLQAGVDDARRSWRLGATLFVAFGLLALAVAAIGLYGMIAYNVNQRMHELGVRVALGARRPDIVRLVVGQSTRFALAGTAAGLLVALAASRWIQPLLFQQSAKDPAIYLAVSGIMLLVALAAGATPALRATRVDPNTALRAE